MVFMLVWSTLGMDNDIEVNATGDASATMEVVGGVSGCHSVSITFQEEWSQGLRPLVAYPSSRIPLWLPQ